MHSISRRTLLKGLAAGVATWPSLSRAEGEIDFNALTGQSVDLHLGNKFFHHAELVKVTTGERGDSLKSMVYRPWNEKKTATTGGSSVAEIYVDGEPLDVAYDAKLRVVAFSEGKRRERLEYEARVGEQLDPSRGERLWPNWTLAAHEAALEQAKLHVGDVQKTFASLRLNTFETRYYLFVTDLTQQQIAPYIQQLDAMYLELSKGFSIPEGKNIWHGKCLVFVFSAKEAFQLYEAAHYRDAPPGNVQGLCHNHGDGRVVISCYPGQDPAYFGAVLVHETSHGFLHRYLSSVPIPTWINEGIADWIAGVIVKSDSGIRRRQENAIDRVRQTGQVGETFFAGGSLESWQYGLACSMVTFLLKRDAKRYRKFLIGIKEGADWVESLKASYQLTPPQFLAAYGQAVGIPQLGL